MDKGIFAFNFSSFSQKGVAIFATLLLLNSSVWAQDLAEIYDLAVNNDPQIRQARAEFNASHTTVAQGRSQLLPSITATASTARETSGPESPVFNEDGILVQPGHSFSDSFNSKGYGLNLRQSLVNFQAWYSYQSILKSDQAAAANLASSEQELILRVANAYFDVLRSIDNLEAYQAELEASERILQQSNGRFEVGLVAITDVYESQASYDLARANMLVEENNLDQRYEALEAITGRGHSSISTLSEDFPIEPANPNNMDEWLNIADENNLDIRAARLTYEAREEEARAARAALYPTVNITAAYNWNETGTTFSFIQGASERSNITLNFSMPIFAGGLNNARKRQAYYNRDASEEFLLRTERSSTQSIRNSYRSVESDVLTIAARQQAIVSARSQLEATEAGAAAGTRNIVDVVIAQRLLFQAQRDYANARYNYVINTLNLKQAAGLLSPQDIIDLNAWLER